jgi:hypothetical protein
LIQRRLEDKASLSLVISLVPKEVLGSLQVPVREVDFLPVAQ